MYKAQIIIINYVCLVADMIKIELKDLGFAISGKVSSLDEAFKKKTCIPRFSFNGH